MVDQIGLFNAARAVSMLFGILIRNVIPNGEEGMRWTAILLARQIWSG